MIPFCVRSGDITSEDRRLALSIAKHMEVFDDDLTCHQVCEELSRLYPRVRAIRGKFAGIDHSWLEVEGRPLLIIDPYPWAAATGPILLTLEGYLNPWRFIYNPLPSGIRVNEIYGSRIPSL